MVGNNLGFTWVQPGDIWRPLGWDLGFIWFHMGFWIDVIDWIWLDHICGCGEPLFKTALTVPQWLVCLPCQTVCPPDQNACICLMILNFLVHHMLCFVKAELVESAQLGFQECRATLSTITLTTLIWRFASNFRSKTFAVTISTCFDWNLLMGHALSTSSIHIFAMLRLGQMSWSEKMPNWSAKFWSSNFRR